MSSVTNRFFEVLNLIGETPTSFSCKIPNITTKQKLSNAKNGRNSIQIDVVSYLCSTNEKVNADYILTGRGKPLKASIFDIPETQDVTLVSRENYDWAKNKGLHLLPQVNFKFAAGQTQLVNATEDITRYWYLPDCKDCEGVAQIVGNSMSPTLPSGCWVALKRYTLPHENPNTIPFGNIFGIVVEDKDTGEYHGHIKVLRRYKELSLANKYWIAHSINTEEFDDFDIEISQVRGLWIVKQHIVSDTLL